MRTSIATVCLSGALVEKLHACADAGFDGVEIMDADLIAAPESPEEIRALCARLGLGIDMFQPFRDVEGVEEAVFADTLRRAEAKFATMARLGTDLVLVCSNVGTASIDDDALAAEQLGRFADAAAAHGIRVAYEALAWGRFVDDYRHAWRLVERAARPNLGVCLDSFHILSRGHDPADIAAIPAEKIFFLQLADAPALDMDVLSWSRHHRVFPGEGEFDLTRFITLVMEAGYTGPWSLEVFNDTFRQTDPRRTAAHARRSLTWLGARAAAENGWERDALGAAPRARAVDFVEIAGADLAALEQQLSQLGFRFRGRHRSKPVRLWTAGEARIVLSDAPGPLAARVAGIGLETDDADAAWHRARSLGSAAVFRRTYAGEHVLRGVEAPDGTEFFWSDTPARGGWVEEFGGGAPEASDDLTGVVDHVNLGYRWQDYDEAVLFATSVLALEAERPSDVPGPTGLIRSQVMRTGDGVVRLPINLAPPTAPTPARHVAIRCDDVIGAVRLARERGLRTLPVPENYYADLAARFDLDDDLLETLQELGLLYDRDERGGFVHVYARMIGDVFLELVERTGEYDGYGAANAGVRLAAQRTLRD